MSKMRQSHGLVKTPVRSIRCPQDVWNRAKKRADSDDITMSLVIRLLLEGYANRMIDAPELRLVFPDGEEDGS